MACSDWWIRNNWKQMLWTGVGGCRPAFWTVLQHRGAACRGGKRAPNECTLGVGSMPGMQCCAVVMSNSLGTITTARGELQLRTRLSAEDMDAGDARWASL